ncbi:ankyrin repeat protein, putative [Trichomonas vaginalis G3]|uniref:Ankyrin repeat protein, putative n=1 Tax=Trichomonas vaginalis (strain ATCC PRA-98 / G3) TaxID=412133 RepID=A2ETS1_TRIV3|nr:spectrin binding [Trichomonas vaginalis G3]EAY03952.1 ankyrin repeat protein, putative [Trichomonas vaginalis G3]KAI5541028.1 spectrin binding [Trichomonas vaginalis G3]|eukprot:XP_001316175.1 ankyrin repeat protein [Trichomonas vaginalis G3]
MTYQEVIDLYKDHISAMDALYKVNTYNEDEIDQIYKKIQMNLIKTKLLSLSWILKIISNISIFRNRYMSLYWLLFKKIFEEYRPDQVQDIEFPFEYFVYKDYGIILNEDNVKSYENLKISIDVHQENDIFKAIMDDDIKKFITFTDQKGFDQYQRFNSILYPKNFERSYSLLELCCYHGAVKCFKLLIAEFKSEITHKCLQFSFLSGVPDIINECLKYVQPDVKCMKYAIISHNIDFVMFLYNEYHINIDLLYCGKFNNLQAFAVYLDQTKNLKHCFIYSSIFNIPSLCQFFLLHGVSINEKDKNIIPYNTSLYRAAQFNCIETVKFLIKCGMKINGINGMGRTALHEAVRKNSKKAIKLLVMHGAEINLADRLGITPLHLAAHRASKEIVEYLISHGAKVNSKNDRNETPLHFAAVRNGKEIVEFLIINGAKVNVKNKESNTPLHIAAINGFKETLEVLILHGADINSKNSNRSTPLHLAALSNNKEIIELLILHKADINAKNSGKETPLSLTKNKQIISILRSHGA